MKFKNYSLLIMFGLLVLTSCGNPNINSNNSTNSDVSITGSNVDSTTTSSDSTTPSTSTTPGGFSPENPAAIKKTIKELNDIDASDTTHLYRITGIVQYPKDTRYGNFDIVDSTGYIYVYGLTYSNSGISKSGSTYSFSNDRSFSSTGISAGDTVTLEGIITKYMYSKTYGIMEFQGYPTARIDGGRGSEVAKSYTASEPTDTSGTYYANVNSKTGSDLEKSLQELLVNTHNNYLSYNSLDSIYKFSDPNGSKVKCFYSGQATTSFNKEHVWPQSLSKDNGQQLYGTDHCGSDLHHIRPTISKYNSARGSSMYGEVFGTSGYKTLDYSDGKQTKYTSNVFEPADTIKGDCARIIMYVYVHYSTLVGSNKSESFMGNLYLSNVMGPSSSLDCKNLLRSWNASDPVSQDEITRNKIAFNKQGNRNPFIDHPTYADKIWG
jgi:endonuclease I